MLGDAPIHETRSQRHGRALVNYSVKYHPMDDVTRPKRAQRITGSRSLSAPGSQGEESSSEDEPELSSGEGTDSDGSNSSDESDTATARLPDPRATRHSARPEAHKQVNYSKAHHPQDHSLPGFQHRAKRRKRSQQHSKPSKKARTVDKVTLSSDKAIDSDSDDAGPPAAEDTAPVASSPRKRLKTLGRAYGNPRRTSDDHVALESRRRITPSLPQEESSINRADVIVQGLHAVAAGHQHLKDSQQPHLDYSSVTYGSQTTRMLGNEMLEMLNSVDTPTESASDPATDGSGEDPPSLSVDATITTSPRVDISKALITPSSASTQKAPVKASTQAAGPCLLIERPYLTPQAGLVSKTQLLSTTSRLPLEADVSDYKAASSSTDQAALLTKELPQRKATNHPDEESVRAANESSQEHATGDSDVTQRPSRTSSHTHSLSHTPISTQIASRQVSRDTLPDDGFGSTSFFDEAIVGTQTASQRAQ